MARYLTPRRAATVDVLIVLAFLVVIVVSARQWLNHHDAVTRLDTIAEANTHAARFVSVQNAAWQRRYDSMRVATRQRDTVLVTRLRTVRDTLALVDTVTVREAAPLVRSCSALADDCAAFRVSATTALVSADSLHQADTTRIHAMALDRVAAGDSIRTAIAQRNRRPTWRAVLSTSALLAAVGYVAGTVTR